MKPAKSAARLQSHFLGPGWRRWLPLRQAQGLRREREPNPRTGKCPTSHCGDLQASWCREGPQGVAGFDDLLHLKEGCHGQDVFHILRAEGQLGRVHEFQHVLQTCRRHPHSQKVSAWQQLQILPVPLPASGCSPKAQAPPLSQCCSKLDCMRGWKLSSFGSYSMREGSFRENSKAGILFLTKAISSSWTLTLIYPAPPSPASGCSQISSQGRLEDFCTQ